MRNSWLVALATVAIANADNLAYSPPAYPAPWANGQGDWADAYQKAVDFVSQLTLAEKVNLTSGVGWEGGQCVGNTGDIPSQNFRGFCMQDSPLGVRFADYVSAFPAGVNVAATWSRDLAYARGQAMGEEHRGKGVDIQLGPVAGPLGRIPEGGRNWEGFAPDPVLTGNMMASTIEGIQDAGVIACAKHYIGNEQEHFRQGSQQNYTVSDSISSNIDDVTLHELYLWPFADAVRAGVGSFMCSYNQVNNSYSCGNSYLLNHVLKGELDFQGFVMTDWGAQHSGVGDALAGADMDMPGDVAFDSGTAFWGSNLTIAVLNGTVPEWRVDDMAVRIMSAYFKVGRDRSRVPVNFDSWTQDTYGNEYYYAGEGWTKINDHVDVRGDHAQLIRQIGSSSAVLLKNTNGALPLTGKERNVGVFGADAGSNVNGVDGCADRGCDDGTLAMGWGSGTDNFPYLVTPEQAIEAAVIQNGGLFTAVTNQSGIDFAQKAAAQADTCLVFGNADSGEGYINVDGNVGDRNNLTLWQNAEAMIGAVAGECNNTIVVLHTVGPVLVESWLHHPNITAVLWAGLPGQESGNALVDVLYGKVNPGGKTPFTWGKQRSDWGVDIIYTPNNGEGPPQQDFTEGIFIDYRHFDKANVTPTWEFGYGLSYTTFSFSGLNVQPEPAAPYTPATGKTGAAPKFGKVQGASAYVYPDDINRIEAFIYPWINSTDLHASSGDPNYGWPTDKYVPKGAQDHSPQRVHPAGGAPGGNPGLYDVVATVSVDITNTGSVAGDEVPQVYVSLGGPNDAPKVLRAFDRLTIQPGQSKTWTTTLTRRDVSNWDTVRQNWVVTNYTKTVYVGNSSRKLPLKATLILK
ncbi:putative beta-glucosidase [Talaromyces proteolyticus]|uniref:beta-glucosidase n=1 Tax=Talaromyces proteolyticus TaxID=1131652 RepID=A0AAD4PUZ6_9EURO|nr:putative beta-glucosidase [Talaromyces proteolyticus]KAH8692819.1 putative beta-glucosidase [Talaromyces proteolyticus]